jgi:FkbM family methyltransferase
MDNNTNTSGVKQIADYEKMLEMIYKHILKSGDIVIDIGAHIGRHTIPLADAVLPSGKVFCFEPLPEQYQILLDRIHNYSVAHSPDSVGIFPFNCALGEIDGKVNFIVAENYPEFSGLKKRHYHLQDVVTKNIEVQIHRLDTIKEKFGKVSYIKVDAEGGELQILRGARLLISESRPIISFELGDSSLVNYEYTCDDYYSFFEDLNYRVYSIFGIHMTRDEFLKATKEQFLWDYIAIPAEVSFKFGHGHIKVLLQQLAGV